MAESMSNEQRQRRHKPVRFVPAAECAVTQVADNSRAGLQQGFGQ
jgi:hypothetical protein